MDVAEGDGVLLCRVVPARTDKLGVEDDLVVKLVTGDDLLPVGEDPVECFVVREERERADARQERERRERKRRKLETHSGCPAHFWVKFGFKCE